MMKFILLFLLILLLPKESFQINLKTNSNNIYKNYDLSELKKEYESIISDYNLNNNEYEKDLSNIYNQLNNIQFSNFTNYNDLDWFINNNNKEINNNNSKNNLNNNEDSLKKLKIGIIVSSFEGMYSTSGIGTVYSILADFLVSKGDYNVTVIYTRDDPPEKKSFYDWKVDLASHGINLVSLPSSPVRIDNPLFVRKSYQVYQYLLGQSFDVLHFPDFEGMAYYSCLAKSNGVEEQFRNVKIVVGLHGPSRWVSSSNGQLQFAALDHDQVEVDWMERKSVELADVIWTPSNYIVQWLVKEQGWSIPQDKLYLLPFLPPKPLTSSIVNTKKTSSIIKEIVFFGRLEIRKGIVLFCDALDQLMEQSESTDLSFDSIKSLKITFLGRSASVGPIDSIDYIRDRSVKWSFSNVDFLEEKSSTESLEYLTDDLHKLVVIPSLDDNAPYTLYECLYSRIPFIATNQPSMIPLIQEKDHSSVLFDSNSDSLVKKLQSIIVKGKQEIGRPTFSKEKSQQLWLNFYKLKIEQDKTLTTTTKSSTTRPLISICLTHYNRPTFLKQAIESIDGQDYSNYEIILVDDGSTSTESIDYLYSLKNLFKKREWKIIMTENKYLGAARNTAAANANGKYLLFLDDDNYLYSNALSTYLEIAENTNANVVSSPHSIFNSTNAPTSEGVLIQRQWVPLGPSLSVGLFKNCFGDANFFIEKQTFDNVGGFTEEIGVGLEDHEILAKLVIDGYKLQVSTQPLLYYRIHDESTQMVFTTDTKSNQMRYIRPFSSVLSDGHKPVLKVLASKSFQQHTTSKRLLVDRCNITMSSIQPNYGPPSGGSLVSIIGSGFDCGISSVLFGGASCSNPKVRTDSILTCTTPSVSKPGTVDIVVKGSDGSQISYLEGFTFENTIAVKSCSLGSIKGTFLSCSISKPADTSDSSCSHIFTGNTLSLFGSTAPTCQWTSSTLLMVTFGSSPKANVGNNLEFVAGGIKSTEGDSNQYQSIPLEPPKDVEVVSIINAPRILDGCSDLVLDGSQSKGGNGKPLTYVWSMVGGGTNGQDLTNLLSKNNASITIPNDLLTKDTKYSFTLKVMNWLDKEDSSSVSLTKESGSVLNVEIEGPSKIKMSAIDLTLKGNASLSSCALDGDSATNNGKSIKYLWSIEPVIKLDSSKDYTGTTILIPASKWVYGTTYNITFTATSGDQSNFDTTTVVISKRPVIAVIKGADKNYPLNTIIKLDASQSIDPSVTNSTKQKAKSNLSASEDSTLDGQDDIADTGLIYKWSCIIAGKGKSKNGDCGITIPSRPIISFNSSSLGAGTFYIAVDVTPKDDPTRSGSASATIIIVDTPFIDVSIEKLKSFIDPSEKLILKSIIGGADAISPDLTFKWTMDEGTLQLPLKEAYSTPTNGRNLVLKAGALGSDCLYTFTIHVTNSKTKTNGIASVTFRTEAIPEGGDITVSPSSGTVTDSYTVSMGDQWTANTGIVGYNFRYRVGSNGPAVALNDQTNSSEITTYLPPGDITIIGYATSGNGITASKSIKVKVSKDPNTEKVINFLSSIVTNPQIDIYQLSIAIKIANSLVPAKSKSTKLVLNDNSGVVNGSVEHILNSEGLSFEEELEQMVIMPDEPNHALKHDLTPENPNAEHIEPTVIITKPPSSNKIMSQAAVATQVSQFKATGIQYVLNKITRENAHLSNFGISSVVDLICTSTDLSSSVHPTALRDTMKVMTVVSPMMKKSKVLQSDFVSSIEYLGNVNQHVLTIEKSLGKMDPTFTKMVASVSKDLLVVSNSIADGLLYRTINGEVPVSLNANGLTITTFKSLPHDLNSKGQTVEAEDSKFEIPSGVLDKHIKSLKADDEISAKYVSIPSNIHFTHKTPTDTTLYPKVVSLDLLNENRSLAIENLKESILIEMGKVSAPEGKQYKCAWWQESKSQWSTEGCSTTKKSGTTYCKCNHLTQFGLLEYASSGKNIWIYVGPIVGGVVFAALLVGTVVIVKRKKNKDKKKKINKTKEQRAKEKEDKKQQEKDSKEAKKKEKEDKKSANAKGKESADKQDDEGDQSIPKNKKDKDSFGDENDVQYILQEFKDIFIEAKKREQLKLLKNHEPISPVSSNGTSGSSTSTPITSTVQIPPSDPPSRDKEVFAPSSSGNVDTTNDVTNNKDKSARVIQKAWKNYCNIKQLKKEAEVEELLDNIGELLSDGEQDPFENDDQPIDQVDDEDQVENQGDDTTDTVVQDDYNNDNDEDKN